MLQEPYRASSVVSVSDASLPEGLHKHCGLNGFVLCWESSLALIGRLLVRTLAAFRISPSSALSASPQSAAVLLVRRLLHECHFIIIGSTWDDIFPDVSDVIFLTVSYSVGKCSGGPDDVLHTRRCNRRPHSYFEFSF